MFVDASGRGRDAYCSVSAFSPGLLIGGSYGSASCRLLLCQGGALASPGRGRNGPASVRASRGGKDASRGFGPGLPGGEGGGQTQTGPCKAGERCVEAVGGIRAVFACCSVEAFRLHDAIEMPAWTSPGRN